MKIILSRKGFDSEYGRVASPILPDGCLVSLPIPSGSEGAIPYDRQYIGDGTLGRLVTDLTRRKRRKYRYTGRDKAHLDPDLRASTLHGRQEGWRPIFGQAGAAQTHLARAGIGPGDLFLFFGWFRRVQFCQGQGCYRFVPDAFDLHVIFGWLQVSAVLPAGPSARAAAPSWARYHTHFHNDYRSNTVYLASQSLKLPGLARRLPGGGVFERFSADLVLTAPGKTRSIWKLPRFFKPVGPKSIMTYHNPARWTVLSDCCILETVGKGQEFVIDAALCPQAVSWAQKLIENNVPPRPQI